LLPEGASLPLASLSCGPAFLS